MVCRECQGRFSVKRENQMMAPLTRSRLPGYIRAFGKIGVDCAGPYLTKQGRGRTKAKCNPNLSTWLVTRAVQLENVVLIGY